MNTNSPFGRTPGAFQAPSNTSKTGLFQAFGQQSSSSQPQTLGFGSTATFGQPSVFSQPATFGQTPNQTTTFGQAPAFGQTPSLGQSSLFGQTSSSFPTMNQAPAFGQTNTGFSSAPPSFGQTSGQNQGSVFGQTPAFGQSSTFGQSTGFSQTTSGFGQSPVASQVASGSTGTLGTSQPMAFGKSPFGQPMSTTSSSAFVTPQAVTRNMGFGKPEFSFKPSNDVVFKPIFSASPEPTNPPQVSVSEPFGTGSSQASSTTMESSSSSTPTTGFSLLPGTKNNSLGFSFSQPTAAPSISTPKNPLTTSSNTSTSSLHFTFSQPAAPSSTNTNVAATQPTTPSSFSFSAKDVQPKPQTTSLFGGSSFGQPSAFGDPKVKAEPSADETAVDQEGIGETNVFARLGKGTKRKEDPAGPSPSSDMPVKDEGSQSEGDAPRQPPKRALLRSHGPGGGLFSRAMSGLMKNSANPVKREVPKEGQKQLGDWKESETAQSRDQGAPQPATQPRAQAPIREVLERAEESDPVGTPEPKPEPVTPQRRTQRRESSDTSLTPTDSTVLQCKNIPPALNQKDLLEKHFGRFGKVRRVFCRPNKNLAIVHFQDHASAAKAKKRGKVMHRQELVLFWQKKRGSPGESGGRPVELEDEVEGGSPAAEVKASSSPLRRPPPRAAAISTAATLSRSSPVKKPSLVKALQFDSEPQQEASPESQGSERPVSSSSLQHLLGQVAETAEDKYRLLEQRDKILRQGRPKRTDLDMSKVFVGTCPDMCPEKERYMRETRNQLSVFEVVPNTEMVDHAAAIKEYSRSSADQEEPLPHDLRPLPILGRTMDYLVTQIMDLGQDNYRDWYDFVWNRTRGIRKDITQQHLCCPATVSLIEKCTRFHVHCAHHLCEEPMMTFDAKINNENMTKCLQSLKEMYQDLAQRQVYCPHEAEFRQYNVLLKLNDGDILREVQQFREEVRNSPEVKFAVQAFAALNSNNFVRFFKLVKAASYLASCLLHRYFNQVRVKALRTLNTAHTFGSQRSTAFPLEDMVRMLMFRDAAEATDFIQHYGLSISDSVVELNRTAYQDPELPVPQKRSEVILGKRTCLIGEVVHGAPLCCPPQHTPVCSFDSHSRYRGEGPTAEPSPGQARASPAAAAAPAVPSRPEVKTLAGAEPLPQIQPAQLLPEPQAIPQPSPQPAPVPATDQAGETGEAPGVPEPQLLFQPIVQPQPVRPPSPPPKPQPVYSEQDIQAELEAVMEEVVETAVREVAEAAASYTATALMESSGQMEALISEVVGQMLQQVSAQEVQLEQERIAEEKRKQEEARRRQEHEAFLSQFSSSLCAEIVQEVLDQSIQESASSEIQEALAENAERVSRCSEQVCSSLVEETLDADIAILVKGFLEAELRRIHKYIKRWRNVVAVRRQLKRQMRGFPAAPCCVDPAFKLKALAPSAPARPSLVDLACGRVNLGSAGTMTFSSTRLLKMRQEAIHKMKVHYYYQQLMDESVWAPLDLPALVTQNISSAPSRIFWKAALLLPSDDESVASPADRILSDWLEMKLGGGEKPEVKEKQEDGTLQSLCVIHALKENGQHTHKVHISVKVSRGPLTQDGTSKAEESGELQGLAALLMLLPAQPACPEDGQEEQDVPLLSALLQLKQLQQAGPWTSPVPLALLVPGQDSGANSTQKLQEALKLQTFVEEGLVSEYIYLHIPETTTDLQGSQKLSQAMRWLLARSPPASPLSCQTLTQLLDSTLSSQFSTRLRSHQQERASLGLPSLEPLPVIQLFNSVVTHVAEVVCSEKLCDLHLPPGEFLLQDTRHLVPAMGWNSLEHLAWLRKAILSLHLPPWDPPANAASWSELRSSISAYCAQVPASRLSQPLLMSQLENLLERVHWQNRPCMGSPGTGPTFQQVPWDQVVLLCIDHKLKDWQVPSPPVCEDTVTEDGEILVFFPTEALKGFQPPEDWTQAVGLTHREKQPEAERAGSAVSGLPTKTLPLKQRLFQSLRAPAQAPPAPLDITHTPTFQELLPLRVLQGLEKEKAQSQRSMEQLQRWLDADPLDYLSMPLFLPSSTLISSPPSMVPTRSARAPARAPPQEQEVIDPVEKVDWLKSPPVSMTRRLRDIERQILASKELELACQLKLNGLLNIVED